MHVTVRQIDPQCKMVDYLTLPQLETIIPPQVIQKRCSPNVRPGSSARKN